MKIHDKSPEEYLQGQQVIMELCMDIHIPNGQKNAANNYFRKFFGVMFSRIGSSTNKRIKVVVFGHNNFDREMESFTSTNLALFLPSLIGLVAFVFVPATAENPGIGNLHAIVVACDSHQDKSRGCEAGFGKVHDMRPIHTNLQANVIL